MLWQAIEVFGANNEKAPVIVNMDNITHIGILHRNRVTVHLVGGARIDCDYTNFYDTLGLDRKKIADLRASIKPTSSGVR